MLVSSRRAGAEAEFEAAVDSDGRRLYALALSMLGDAHEAADAVQETMEQAWRSWDSLNDPSRRGVWLATICTRTCLRLRHRLRSRWRHAEIREEEPDRAPTEPRDLDLVRACRSLSARQRSVVLLHYMYGFTLDECAGIIGCRPGTVRPHLRRALVKLREAYSDS